MAAVLLAGKCQCTAPAEDADAENTDDAGTGDDDGAVLL
jgi:hypothetical protein